VAPKLAASGRDPSPTWFPKKKNPAPGNTGEYPPYPYVAMAGPDLNPFIPMDFTGGELIRNTTEYLESVGAVEPAGDDMWLAPSALANGDDAEYMLVNYTDEQQTAIFDRMMSFAQAQDNPCEPKSNSAPGHSQWGAPTTTNMLIDIRFSTEPEANGFIGIASVPEAIEFLRDEGVDIYGPNAATQYFNTKTGAAYYLRNFDYDKLMIIRDLLGVPEGTPLQMSAYHHQLGTRLMQKNPPKQNPAWVTKHLADSWVTLESKVPPQWMPKLDRTVAKGKRLSAEIPEYGCGAYGCVLPTLDPKVVLKLTTDDTEAEFAARLAKQLPVPIVTIYELVYHLPTAKRQGRNVYLLWREAADHVGEVDKVVGSHAEDAIAAQHKAAQEAFDRLSHGEPAERELAAWVKSLKAMAKVPELRWLANGMLAAYEEKGIVFGDIHGSNVGQARGQWVITDPGHVAVVAKENPCPVGDDIGFTVRTSLPRPDGTVVSRFPSRAAAKKEAMGLVRAGWHEQLEVWDGSYMQGRAYEDEGRVEWSDV
jgi:hypothetical protein